jgi:RNA polymerase sigma-70 factor (ECF subfamily)
MYEVEARGSMLQIIGTDRTAASSPKIEISVDAALVEAVRAGDRDAYGQLYATYTRMVHGILLARVPYGEVDDLVQDVFLVALRKIDSLRDANLFGPWLAMITRNRAMDFHRRTRDTAELSDDLPAANTSAPEAEATEVLNLIRLLPEAYREPLILRFVEGMTGPEIAGRTGLAPASVRVNIHRGMKLLREKLGAREVQKGALKL